MTAYRALVIGGVVPSGRTSQPKQSGREMRRRFRGVGDLHDIEGRSPAGGELADTGD